MYYLTHDTFIFFVEFVGYHIFYQSFLPEEKWKLQMQCIFHSLSYYYFYKISFEDMD